MASSKAWINVEKKSMNGKSVRVGACLLVGDIVKMVKFYRDVLGFNTEWDGGNYQTFEIALWLPNFSDVDAEYERLSKLNVPFPCGASMTFDFGIRNFYVVDPEGNLLEIGSMNEIPVS